MEKIAVEKKTKLMENSGKSNNVVGFGDGCTKAKDLEGAEIRIQSFSLVATFGNVFVVC